MQYPPLQRNILPTQYLSSYFRAPLGVVIWVRRIIPVGLINTVVNNAKIYNIREAKTSDLTRLTEIYNQAIVTQNCTCDTQVFTVQERTQWFNEHRMSDFPVFVCEADGKVVGYSYIFPYRSGREALRRVCEISYYIDFDYHHKGIGSQLLEHTIHVTREKGFRNVIACADGLCPRIAEIKCPSFADNIVHSIA